MDCGLCPHHVSHLKTSLKLSDTERTSGAVVVVVAQAWGKVRDTPKPFPSNAASSEAPLLAVSHLCRCCLMALGFSHVTEITGVAQALSSNLSLFLL